MKYFLIIIGLIISIASCYREVINTEPDADMFKLQLTTEKQQFIYNTRDTSYSIEDPDLRFFFNDQLLELKEIRVRGKSSLRYQRKSYTVFLSESIMVQDRYGANNKLLSRFKLLALPMDFTYIENRVAFGILEEAGVMPLFFKFVEFRINNETQGVYFLVEDPEQFYKEHGSEYILRRGYNHRIDDSDYEPSFYFKPFAEYEKRFYEIYNVLSKYQGADLYRELSARMDLELYFRKMGVDYLIQNGDYTDEIYLYSMVQQDTIRFYPIPWDYDDIFKDKPHEVGSPWGPGTIFGKRYYESMDDIYNEVGRKLIFSIEDDLDYTIARDPYLYEQYINALTRLMMELNTEIIERIFTETTDELSTFYNSIAVVEQSTHDAQSTSRNLWLKNMQEKQELILERLEHLQQQLITIN